jgi:Peptidase family M48
MTTSRLRTWLLVAGLTALLVAAGALAGGPFLYGFVALAVLMNLGGYWFSDRIALAASCAQPLDDSEVPWLRAAVAELAHCALIAGAISAVANLLQLSFLFGGDEDDDGPLGFVGALAPIILAPIAAVVLQLAVSRQREYLADATAARLLGGGGPLADALEGLERGTQAAPLAVNPAFASLYITNPLPRAGLAALFSTHPPILERVRRLRADEA